MSARIRNRIMPLWRLHQHLTVGDTAAAALTDQRGVPRPYGPAADIGAYECAALSSISRAAGRFNLVFRDGASGQPCRLLTSANLSDWQCVATNQVGADGTVVFWVEGAGDVRGFFRTVSP